MSKLSNAEYQLHVSHDSAKSAHGLSTTGTPPPRMLKYMDFGMDELCLIYSGETTLFNDRPSLVTSNYYGAVPPSQDKTNDLGETVIDATSITLRQSVQNSRLRDY